MGRKRIIFGTHITPKESILMEEFQQEKSTLLREDSLGNTLPKDLGGKGNLDIAEVQWSDSWTSMAHSQMYWEDWADTTATRGNKWEDVREYWSGIVKVGVSHGVRIASDTSTDDAAFLYIKNTGDYDLSVALTRDHPSAYLILIPPNGSISLNCTSDLFEISDAYMKAVGSNTTAEYIIAN